MNAWGHFKTITKHKFIVMTYCFRAGMITQGLLHDLSKYSPSEFLVGAKYYSGVRSPNVLERQELGYSTSWIHHKGRNKHHFEYWVDNSKDGFYPVPMPKKYIAEMVFDRIAACKTYNGTEYTDSSPLNYYKMGFDSRIMNPNTKEQIEMLLTMLSEQGERKVIDFIKRDYLKK